MHIRFLLNELQKQYQKHHTYRRVVNDMECKYPSVLKKGECAICWDTFRYDFLFNNFHGLIHFRVKLNVSLETGNHTTAQFYYSGLFF